MDTQREGVVMKRTLLGGFLVMGLAAPVSAQTTFSEVGAAVGVGAYQRAPATGIQAIYDFQEESLINPVPLGPPGLVGLPVEAHGWPGVAVLDYDDDGDLDILVTNGPGAANGLYQNQLAQTGVLSYVDVAVAAGIDTTASDINGVCYGDTDNDGDSDVLLLGRDAPNHFMENNGNGTFTELHGVGLDADSLSTPVCTMGDVDGDGLLDIFIGNSFNYDTGFVAIFIEPWALNQGNQLFLNSGSNSWTDASSRVAGNLDNIPAGEHTITWAVSMVDIDGDGDLDIVHGDDSGGIPVTKIDPINGVDRSFIHILYNDGTGHFTPYSVFERPESPGSWMGVGFGDLDHDGHMDIFGSNFGDYGLPIIGLPYFLGDQATRPLFNRGDGTFADNPLPAGDTSAFGWGTAVFDHDNDGDSDVMYHGSIDMVFFAITENPGVVLNNDGAGNLSIDLNAMGGRHQRRNVHGAAVGDLDRDGFVDVVSVANFVVPNPIPLVPGPQYGAPLDAYSSFTPAFTPNFMNGTAVWNGFRYAPGNLSIDRNNGDSGYAGITVHPIGSTGLTSGAQTPRDGTGAVFSFTPLGSSTTAMHSIKSGSSHTSANAQEAYFGLGTAPIGTLDALWPGAHRNRLYAAVGGEELNFPEIPCSIDTSDSFNVYRSCVSGALNDLRAAGEINLGESIRFMISAYLGYVHSH